MEMYLFLLIFLIIQVYLVTSLNKKKGVVIFGNKRISLSKFLLIIDSIILIVVATFRGKSVGTDTSVYNYWFSYLKEISFKDIFHWSDISKIEVGNGVLAKIGIIIFGSNWGVWLIFNIILFFCIAKFICEFSENEICSLYLFLTFSLYNQSFNICAQYIAGSILLLAMVCLKRDNYKGFFLFFILAIFFHRSAILGIILLPIWKIRKNAEKIGILIVVISFILSRFAPTVIQYIVSKTIYASYLHWEVSSENGVGLAMNILIFGCFIVFYKQMERIDKYANVWVLCAALTVSLNFFIGSLGMIARVMVYFKLFYLASIPCLILTIKQSSRSKIIAGFISFSIILLFAIYYYYSIAYTACFGTVPYKMGGQ